MADMRALLISGGKIADIVLSADEDKSFEQIRDLIGDWFCLAFRGKGSTPNREITAYCDDNGLLKSPPDFNIAVDDTLYRGGYLFAGPVIVTATNMQGETISMTQKEIDSLVIRDNITCLADNGNYYPVLTQKKIN